MGKRPASWGGTVGRRQRQPAKSEVITPIFAKSSLAFGELSVGWLKLLQFCKHKFMSCEICLIMVHLCKLKQLICEISVGWLKLLCGSRIRYLIR